MTGICCTLIRLAALVCVLCSVYLFFGSSFENVLLAFELFSVALALEAVVAVIRRVNTPP
jgi:multisubunit Na+/H+ antiporter MnhC subunit